LGIDREGDAGAGRLTARGAKYVPVLGPSISTSGESTVFSEMGDSSSVPGLVRDSLGSISPLADDTCTVSSGRLAVLKMPKPDIDGRVVPLPSSRTSSDIKFRVFWR
jgi:hypothetical protein